MTAQISDDFLHRDRHFSLAGVKGTGLFNPEEHGLKPQATSTACWRGFVCTYKVADGRLILDKLCLGLGQEETEAVKAGEGPLLFGHRPRYEPKSFDGPIVYSDLAGTVPFSGGLLLADGFIRELYVHMGFHPAWKYQEVHELLFEDGRLVKEIDCSKAMAHVRELLARQQLQPGSSAKKDEIAAWIAKTFSQDYS